MKPVRFFTLLIFLVLANFVIAQAYTVSGYVVDESTGETMIGVNVIVKGEYRGSATDGNGYFRISGLQPGQYTLKVSSIGYSEKEIVINVQQKSMILDDIALKPQAIELEEIEVTGERSEIADLSIEASHTELAPQAIRSIPTSRGDVFRALKFLPGIEGIDPFSPLFSARGGDPGENMVLLDGVTIYNPYHLLSAAGIFNLYAIKNTELLVGGFGAEYGGRNSSILYITTREGNNQQLHGELETSTSKTRAIFDFPVGKNATMMVSTRAFYDVIMRFLFNSPSYFYDTNISLNWKLNQQNRLSLRYFFSRDVFDYSFARFSHYISPTFDTDIFDNYDLIYKNKWNNQAVTAILKTVISPKVYWQTQLSGSFFSSNNKSLLDFEYTSDEDEKIKILYQTTINNQIRELSAKSTLNIKLNAANTFKLGAEYNQYRFENDIQINYIIQKAAARQPNLMAGFIENKVDWGVCSIRPGVRFSKFSFTNKWYSEPRVNASVNLPANIRLKAAWGKYFQYIISINSQEYEISQFIDNYYPLKGCPPSASTHYLLGFEKATTTNTDFSIDFYYKDLSRLYTFDANLSGIEAMQFPEQLWQGSGKAYGLEMLWRGTWHRFSGWVSYGLSRATRNYPHIMNGETFLFDYDRTHSFKAVINHQIHPAISYSGALRILSGVPKTLEISEMTYFYYDPLHQEMATQGTFITDKKNNIRLPLFIRLDFGLKKRIRKGFAAELAKFLGAKDSYLNVTFGNILFLRRNVWLYLPMGEEKYYGIGSNYVPEFGAGYTIKF